MFTVGDSVVYPLHGVCIVEGIEEHDVLGSKTVYYILKNKEGKMQAMVPIGSSEMVGLRSVGNDDEYTQIMEFLSNTDEIQENANWNQRYRDNIDRLKNGKFFSVAEVFKTLRKRNASRGLSTSERKIFQTAKQVLISELMHISGKSLEDFETLLEI